MNECEIMEFAARLINRQRPGLNAAAEHTGGGIICITLDAERPDGAQWFFGTANETWGGSLVLANGDYGEPYLDTDLPSDCGDPAEIAAAILGALAGAR